MSQPDNLASAPRCLAMTRKGAACQSHAVKGRKRCRMHGGTNPGAPKGNRNAWKHGARSAEASEEARAVLYVKQEARRKGLVPDELPPDWIEARAAVILARRAIRKAATTA